MPGAWLGGSKQPWPGGHPGGPGHMGRAGTPRGATGQAGHCRGAEATLVG